jgi:hypothetical protein
MAREQRIRVSKQEKRLLETLKNMKYGDDAIPLGAVVGDACRAVIARRDAEADSNDSGVRL